MRNIRLLIAYDGTEFSGWEKQKERRTVQGEMEKALEKICKVPVRITGSGRTDAGVHAAGQTANFYSPVENMGASRYVPALNSLLPQDIRIMEASEASADFHARFDAKMRTYRYSFICGRPALPQEARYALQLWRQPRPGLLNAYCRFLLGERDCTVFSSPRDQSKSRMRHIFQACFFISAGALIFEIGANAFLWKMVRSIGGTLLDCEEKDVSEKDFKTLVESGDRRRAGVTLPAKGLCLWGTSYYRN
ncbi:MAG: tRNA pseudouridine(38-40) synthase TruA [Treponema sp.]|jgi:tRNA pseudouridine38-40 synthase|nr:tRNA pseudouridine(38-40) synthase TruA [Treponema sp.]